jgi:hypothetical protein
MACVIANTGCSAFAEPLKVLYYDEEEDELVVNKHRLSVSEWDARDLIQRLTAMNLNSDIIINLNQELRESVLFDYEELSL